MISFALQIIVPDSVSTKILPFRTAYSEPLEIVTPSGKPTNEEWGYKLMDDGSKKLVVTGETNVYAKIQEDLEGSKIENILKRASIGDMTDFRPDGIYADTTEFPTNMIDAQRAIINMENTWNNLPKEIRDKYDNDVGKFIAASGSEEWMKNMGLIKEEPVIEKPKEEEGGIEDE